MSQHHNRMLSKLFGGDVRHSEIVNCKPIESFDMQNLCDVPCKTRIWSGYPKLLELARRFVT